MSLRLDRLKKRSRWADKDPAFGFAAPARRTERGAGTEGHDCCRAFRHGREGVGVASSARASMICYCSIGARSCRYQVMKLPRSAECNKDYPGRSSFVALRPIRLRSSQNSYCSRTAPRCAAPRPNTAGLFDINRKHILQAVGYRHTGDLVKPILRACAEWIHRANGSLLRPSCRGCRSLERCCVCKGCCRHSEVARGHWWCRHRRDDAHREQ